MSVREVRQAEAVQAYLASDRKSIINACPRFGKIKVAIDIMKIIDPARVVILAPRNDIFSGWSADFHKFGWMPTYYFTCTFTSIKKLDFSTWGVDVIIIDEPHEMSVNQQVTLREKVKGLDTPILGLTGTMTDKTRNELYDNLGLDSCYVYSIAQGVKEGILADYAITVHKVPLDFTRRSKETKKGLVSEKKLFDTTDYLRVNAKKNRHFFELKMINILQNSISKMEETRRLIKSFEDKRVLVFCGVTDVADNLGIPVYHSKKKEEEIFNEFCKGGSVDKLATIKMMQAGITITPINVGILNYMSGNPEDSAQKICRFLGLEYNNPEKKAEIHIVSSNEGFELSRLKTGLGFFDPSKISYI